MERMNTQANPMAEGIIREGEIKLEGLALPQSKIPRSACWEATILATLSA